MLTTLANAKEFLKVPVSETADDAILNRIISAADAFVKNYCRRVIEAADLTEYHSTKKGQVVLMLDEYPVNSVTSLHDDTERVYGTDTLIATTDYIVDKAEGIIRLDGIYFYAGLQNVQVVYNAGYSTVPADLEQAALELVAQKYHAYDKIRQGIESRSFDGESVRFFLGEMLKETKAVLDRYRKMR